jgi:hypothetical protein
MRNVINVLVVALIVLFGGALLAVAVSRVRDSAARMDCANNLRQIAISVINYGDTCGRLPSAAMANQDLPPEQRLSWIVDVMPYVESSNLFSQMDKKKGWEAEENRFAALMRLRILQCPGYPERPPVSTLAPTHYVGISGIGTNAVSLPQGDPRAGFFGFERKLTLEDIKGRTGMIMMLAETADATDAWTAAGSPSTRGLEPAGSPYLGPNGQFGGNHRRGIQVVFADGSVRFVEDSIEPEAWEASARIHGAETEGDE